MMTLTTISEKKSDTEARVFWRAGTKKRGILDVTLDFAHADSALIAELVALQHLLFDRKVFDREPGAGAGYKLVVSKGAIRKLALGKSNKAYATKFAAFLSNRMKGVTIEVSQDYEFMAKPDEVEPELLGGEREVYANTYDAIETPAMGRVLVTQHAVEQYQARITSGSPKKPWASLVGRLMHPELRMMKVDEKVLRHKARKYGRSDNVEFWGHPTSVFVYQVLREDNGDRVLVTVFERSEP
ncbi:hypothetical protein [Marinobacterium aestuariivivens]|uniref:Uncharacterized protein n=1 Tax=Marinobacterium aestuariivivens TaxID=1698799 RepID=A0ABW2A9W3_9GAMM